MELEHIVSVAAALLIGYLLYKAFSKKPEASDTEVSAVSPKVEPEVVTAKAEETAAKAEEAVKIENKVQELEAVLNNVAVPAAEETKKEKPKKPKKITDKVGVLKVTPKTSSGELAGLDKKALLAKAKELNVAVNSRMTKEQIIQKLIKA